jgi:hypothetical protein
LLRLESSGEEQLLGYQTFTSHLVSGPSIW